MTGREAAPKFPVNIVSFSCFCFCSKNTFSSSSFSSEKIQALHTELDSVQALRRQLDEVLARTRDMALVMERAAKRQPDFGGGDGQGPASRAAGGIVTNAP